MMSNYTKGSKLKMQTLLTPPPPLQVTLEEKQRYLVIFRVSALFLTATIHWQVPYPRVA